MSDSQHHAVHDPAMDAADGERETIGRGSGFTITEMKRRFKEFFRRKKINTKAGQWRTLKQKQPEQYRAMRREQVERVKAENRKEKPDVRSQKPEVGKRAVRADFRSSMQHSIHGVTDGIRLKKSRKDVWSQL